MTALRISWPAWEAFIFQSIPGRPIRLQSGYSSEAAVKLPPISRGCHVHAIPRWLS